jgi:hypothetical protein
LFRLLRHGVVDYFFAALGAHIAAAAGASMAAIGVKLSDRNGAPDRFLAPSVSTNGDRHPTA